MSTQKLYEQLAKLVENAYTALSEVEEFATKHKLDFGFHPARGMGGYFNGAEVGQSEEFGTPSDGRNPSSQSC